MRAHVTQLAHAKLSPTEFPMDAKRLQALQAQVLQFMRTKPEVCAAAFSQAVAQCFLASQAPAMAQIADAACDVFNAGFSVFLPTVLEQVNCVADCCSR